MKCPRCNVDLKPKESSDRSLVTLDVCQTCKGAWFDKGELNRLDESVWVDAEQEIEMRPAEGAHQGLDCPSCAARLEPVSPADAPDLIVDRCGSCGGFWLDDGELEKMQDVVSAEHDDHHENMVKVRRPKGWSLLRWLIYRHKSAH